MRGHSTTGRHELALTTVASGGWTVNGAPAPELDGCLDVDLEASALTNPFAVHRLGLRVGQQADAPAAYVRALDLRVERLHQRYSRRTNDGNRQRYHHAAPAFGFETELLYDEAGLVIDYPGIAVRAASARRACENTRPSALRDARAPQSSSYRYAAVTVSSWLGNT